MESIDRRGFGRSSGPRGAAASMRKPDIMREKFPKKKHLKPATFWRMIREAIDRNSGNSVSKRELLAAGFERDVALEYVRQGCYDMEILEHQEAVNWLWVCFWALFHSKSKNVFEDLVWEQERGDITFSLRPKGASSEHQVIKASSQIEKYGEKTEEEEMYSPLLNDRQPKIPVGAISEKQIEAQPMGHGAVEPEERDIVSQDEGDGGSQPAADRRAGPLHAALATDGAVPAPPTHAGFATFEDDRGRGMGGSATIVNEAVKTIVQELRERHLPYITVGLVRRDPTLCEKFTELYRQWKGDPAVSSERAIKNIFSALSSSRGGAYDGECLKAERVMGELRYSLPDPTLGLPQASEAEPEKDLFKLLKNRELVKGGVVDLGGSTWFVTGPLTVDYPLVLKNGTICGLRQINAGPSLVITNVTLCWRESHFKTRMESFEVEGSEKGVTGAEVKTTTWKQRTGHSAAADGANLAHGGAALQTPPSQVLIGQKRLAPGSCDSHGADGAAERPSRQRRCSDTGGAVGQDAADKDLCGQLALDWPTRGNAFHRSFMLPIGGPPVDLGHQILACWDMASSSQGRHALTLVIEASAAPDPGQALKVLSRLASVVSGDAPALRAVADIAHRQANAGLSRVSQSLADSKASIDTAAAVEAVGRYAAIRRAVDLAGVLEATARALDACEGVAALAKMVLEEGRLVLAKRWRGGQGREEGLDGSVQRYLGGRMGEDDGVIQAAAADPAPAAVARRAPQELAPVRATLAGGANGHKRPASAPEGPSHAAQGSKRPRAASANGHGDGGSDEASGDDDSRQSQAPAAEQQLREVRSALRPANSAVMAALIEAARAPQHHSRLARLASRLETHAAGSPVFDVKIATECIDEAVKDVCEKAKNSSSGPMDSERAAEAMDQAMAICLAEDVPEALRVLARAMETCEDNPVMLQRAMAKAKQVIAALARGGSRPSAKRSGGAN